MLRGGPKRDPERALPVDPDDDARLRLAFGYFGGLAAARAAAVPIVRRLETTDDGHWLYCDCLKDGTPPVLVPVAETHLRRHVTEEWPAHAPDCEFFRDSEERRAAAASYQPLRNGRLRLVRSFEGSGARRSRLDVVSPVRRRPRLARLLAWLLTEAGLQRIAPDGDPSILDQIKAVWSKAGDIWLDEKVRLTAMFCTSLAKLPDLMERVGRADAGDFAHTRPHGLALLRFREASAGRVVALDGSEFPVSGRLAIFGERPDGEAEAMRPPYLGLCVAARPEQEAPVQLVSAYLHPCVSTDRLTLIDSDFERETLKLLRKFQWVLGKRQGIAVTMEKPLESLGPEEDAEGGVLPPLIPDFLLEGGGRRIIVETMGYGDALYRARKEQLHPLMLGAAAADLVLPHDFHEPPRWRQDWRDKRFTRGLWKLFEDGAHGTNGAA
jgi:hypothetical protein